MVYKVLISQIFIFFVFRVNKSNNPKLLLFTKTLTTFVTSKITTMNTRLKQFLAAENITQSHFADAIKVVRASVSHVLSGRNKPGYDFITAIMAAYPHLNIEWLMMGKGKMYKNNPPQPYHEQGNGLFDDLQDNIFTEISDSNLETVPVYPTSVTPLEEIPTSSIETHITLCKLL